MEKEKKEKKQKKRRYHKVTVRIFFMMIFLAILLLIGTWVAAGKNLFTSELETYENVAYSYARMARAGVPGEAVKRYIETGEEDNEYLNYLSFLNQTAIYAHAKYLYIVVPTEEDYIYIFDTYGITEHGIGDTVYEDAASLMDHDAYEEGEKEQMAQVMSGEWEEKIIYDVYKGTEPLATALLPVWDSEANIVAVLGLDLDMYDLVIDLGILFLNIAVAIMGILLIGMLIIFIFVRTRLIGPVIKLKKATVDIVDNLNTDKPFKANIRTRDEIEQLAVSFEEMDVRLRSYIKENTAITAEHERMSTELELATHIQEDMLPSVFPPFPDRREIDIYAVMDPAKEVGGDFYDFFFVDETHLALVMADVSGKGIPAALFMMMSKIMIQNYTLTGMSPGKVLETVNKQICANNREDMFVTVWLGILDTESGKLVAANAGHEYPILKKPDGSFEVFKDRHGLVVGGMDMARYREYELEIVPGSKLFVYTDGLPEATNSGEEMFGLERTLEALNRAQDQEPKEIMQTVRAAVDEFVGEAPQFDDLTMLCLTYHGVPNEEQKSENP